MFKVEQEINSGFNYHQWLFNNFQWFLYFQFNHGIMVLLSLSIKMVENSLAHPPPAKMAT